ncbi:MAG: arabinose-5-phosphate isomerase [Rhodospirillaceae bacterium]|jgi:arabinose-5-phosphate isomerase|nr:arabinose-5-phosphate isomerase [Rhodospirillaceae bacterium]
MAMTAVHSIRDAAADLAAAERVLRLAAEGLNALATGVDARFARALDLLGGVNGRIVVTGMGKSGHVARKIAATLASTGTPALFVHPAEASHGDLGMIAPGDAVLALSNSGGTAELSHILGFAKRFLIPLVAITSGADSALAEAADVVLLLPRVAEACPHGLAPTTSTTMMLGLGDALAVALLERKGFTPTDFHALHPGGRLGQQLRRVVELMHGGAELPLVATGTRMGQAVLEMTAKRLGCVGITDDAGRLVGIITDGDLRRHMHPDHAAADLLDRIVEEVMTHGPRTIRPQATIAEAIGVMTMKGSPITSLFVVEGERPLGLLHMHDCLRAGAL